jgi:hypothetical protein
MGRFPTTSAGFRPVGLWVAGALAVLALVGLLGAGLARGERSQKGNLIVSLDGELAPLKLPRDRAAPVAISLSSGLRVAGEEALPRVTGIEIGLPDSGVISTLGLPTCSPARIRDATRAEALDVCRDALIGRGRIIADVHLPNQVPFRAYANLLVFNTRIGGRRAVVMHANSARPPTTVVLPFTFRERSGRLGLALVTHLPGALGPWPRFAKFEVTLSRRYTYRGRKRSYLSASCPIPRRFTAGFFSLAGITYTLEDGRQISTGIARGCRAR